MPAKAFTLLFGMAPYTLRRAQVEREVEKTYSRGGGWVR